jgi:hypothetical protein
MTMLHPSPLLRQALLSDAVTSAACGLLMLLGAGPLSSLLGLPELLLRLSGAVLLPYAAVIAYLGMREKLQRPFVWAVVIGNVIWTADSLLLLMSGWVEPTRAGFAFVIGQAVVVLMYAELQYMGLRRSETAVA